MRKLPAYLFLLSGLVLRAQQPFTQVRLQLDAGRYGQAEQILDSCASQKYRGDSVFYYRALTALRQGELKPARKQIGKLMKEYADFGGTEYLLGLLSFSEARYGKSIDHFTKFLNQEPAHAKSLYNRALAYGMLEEFLPAIEDLSTLLAAHPANAPAYYARAYWYEYTGNYAEAARDYEKTIVLDPGNYEAYLGLAFIRHAQGDLKSACEAISKAMEAGSQLAGELRDNYCR